MNTLEEDNYVIEETRIESSEDEEIYSEQDKELEGRSSKRRIRGKKTPRERKENNTRRMNRGNNMRELFEKFIAFSEKENLESEDESGYWDPRKPNRS